MKLRPGNLLFLLVTCIGLWSCGPKKTDNASEFAEAEKSLQEDIKGLVYGDGIPLPSEIPYLLQATGAEYNPSLTNDRRKWETYSQNEKATVNLGVYSADIGYLISYDKTQESLDYLNTCKSLADKLGLSATLDPQILKDFENHIGNRDSLAEILNRTMKKVGEYLKNDNQSKMAALIVTGSFVESLYLATAIVNTYPSQGLTKDQLNNVLTKLIQVILDQKKATSEVARMLGEVDQTGLVPSILADLKTLEADYAAIKIEERMKSNKGGLVFTPADLAGISKTLNKLRTDITL